MHFQVVLLVLIALVILLWSTRGTPHQLPAARPTSPGRRRPLTGPEALPGASGVVVQAKSAPASPNLVRVQGELWSAYSSDPLDVGDRCLVIDVEGNHLIVCPMPLELEPYLEAWP